MSEGFLPIANQSLLAKRFDNLINLESIKLVSFDIFDTLLFRDVSHHSQVFFKIGLHEYVQAIFNNPETFQTYRLKAEIRAKKESIYEEITLDEIYEQMDLTPIQQNKIKAIEIEEEKKSLYLNKQIEHWITKAIQLKKQVVLISDMYLPSEVIRQFVEEKSKFNNLDIFVSSSYRKTKSKKSLYKCVQQKTNVDYNNWLHIGDNVLSDNQQAMTLGIQTILYNVEKPLRELLQLEQSYIKEDLGAMDSLRKYAALQNPYEDEKSNFFFSYGSLLLGPLLYEFSAWLSGLIEKNNISQVCFIMREGKTFEYYFKKLNTTVETKLIYASRKSTFLVNLKDDFEIRDINFQYYRSLTIKDCLSLYELDIDNKVLSKYKNKTIEEAKTIFVSDQSLFEILILEFSKNIGSVRANILKAKQNFQDYLDELDISKNSLIVDLGGNGSMPTLIAKKLQNKVSFNVLFYMHEIGYTSTLNTKTYSFIPFSAQTKEVTEIIRRTPEFLENLLNGLEETTIAYSKKNGKTLIHKSFPHDKTKGLEKIIESVYKGVDALFESILDTNNIIKVNPILIGKMLSRSIDVPTLMEVDYLGRLVHDEGKGSYVSDYLISDEKITTIKSFGLDYIYKQYAKNLFFKRNEFHWIQGLMTSIEPSYIRSMKGLQLENNNIHAIENLLEVLDTNSKIKKIYVYGAGQFFKELKPHLDERGIEVLVLFDNKANVAEFDFLGYKVSTIERIISSDNLYPILITSKAFALEITDRIFKFGIAKGLSLEVINYYNGLSKSSFEQ